jgi:hypothetical protein
MVRGFLSLVFVGSTVLAACGPVGRFGEPRYGVCREQVVEYLAANFQQHVTAIDMTFSERRPVPITIPPSTGQAVVYVAECDGYHVFDVYGTDYDCQHRAHYGTPPTFVRYRTSVGGCRR